MYGQSCREVGRGEVGPLRFVCSVTFRSHRSVGIHQVC